MGMVRPTGGFAAGMLDGGGWPDVAEDAFYDRAQQYVQVLRQTTDVLDTLRQQRSEIFVSGLCRVWPPAPPTAHSTRASTNW
ncbi:hypothetical protein [Mycobacterium genavense]|uniref:hypothetical protein n=1 Tax=Mycobacterium genavense TaxID=36812 RepID=UPI000684B979